MAPKLIPKVVRLSAILHSLLVAEANKTGIGKPAVLARTIIIKRLGETSKWDALAAICSDLPMIAVKDPRICIRIPEQHMDLINKAAVAISNSKFAPMVQAILTEHYKKSLKTKPSTKQE